MKHILLNFITFYQIIISPIVKQVLGIKSQCRYSPSCSHYAKDVIKTYGVVKGARLALQRFLHCQPFAKSYGHI